LSVHALCLKKILDSVPIETEILPWQAEWLTSEDDIICLVGGFASGKTYIACNWFTYRCMQFPDGTHVVVGKDLPQLKRGTLMSLRNVLDKRNIRYTYNSSTGEISLSNGCVIKALSAANYLAFRSLEADTIWADELADWGPSAEIAFKRYLAPRLRYSPNGLKYRAHMKPMMRITTNPPMSTGHWLYETVVTNRYCKCFNVSLRDNYLQEGHTEYINRQERSLSPDLWPLLIDGQWGNAGSGNVYKGFSRQVHCTNPAPPLPPIAENAMQPLLWALDFNVALMCSTISQMYVQRSVYDPTLAPDPHRVSAMSDYTRLERPDYQQHLFYVIDEFRLPNAGAPDVLEAFLARYKYKAIQNGVVIYGDASGSARSQQMSSQQAARSNWAIIVQGLLAENIRVDFRVPTSNPTVWDRVNAVKSQLLTREGVGMFIDLDRCPNLVVDLESVSWRDDKVNEINKDRDPNITHLSDALGYMIWFERTLISGSQITLRGTMDL